MLLKKFNGFRLKYKILIVEDEPDLRTMLALELQNCGYEVFQASDGESGFFLAQEVKPDLIIADVMMPKIDGNQLLKKLRTTDFGQDIPFIVLTARGKMRDYFEGVGAADFIAKPFYPEQLIERVENVLRQSKPKIHLDENSEPQTMGFDKKRILFLENDPVALPVQQSIFENYGYEVKMVTTPAQCLEQAVLFHPDLIVSRYRLDGMNADKLVDLLHGMPQLKAIPIIVYSHTIIGAEKESVMHAGATDFLADTNGIKLLRQVNKFLNK